MLHFSLDSLVMAKETMEQFLIGESKGQDGLHICVNYELMIFESAFPLERDSVSSEIPPGLSSHSHCSHHWVSSGACGP